jgi:type I restriction enzyme, S subunit
MSSEWEISELGKEAVNASRPFEFNEYPRVVFVNTGDVLSGKFLHANVSEGKGLPGQAKKALRKNDILLTEIRPGNGRYAYVDFDASNYVVSTKFMVIESLGRVSPRFLYHVLTNQTSLDEFQRIAESRSGTFPQITFDSIAHFPIPVLPMAEQDRLVEFWDELDNRITLLRETNATLEAIAQALFKSWFVDFDPVHAKQQGRAPEGMDEATAALFPDSFKELELGLVPKGWRVVTLGDVCAVTIGGLWGKDTKEDVDLVPAISLRGVDLENLRSLGFAVDAPVRWVKPAAMEKRRVSESEVLIASSGAGPCGRPLWAGANFESLYGMPVIFSNFVKRLECGNPSKAIYVDRLLAEMRASREIWNYINGTSIPNLDDKLLLATKKVVIPSDDVLAAFEQIARAIYSRLYSQQAQTLATLRDTLLPRLISGQLRLPEASSVA